MMLLQKLCCSRVSLDDTTDDAFVRFGGTIFVRLASLFERDTFDIYPRENDDTRE